MKFWGEPEGRQSEIDDFVFYWGKFVKGGGQRVAVNVDKVFGVWVNRKGEVGENVCIQVERETGEMDLRLRKVIMRLCLIWGLEKSMTNMMTRWSEMVMFVLEML